MHKTIGLLLLLLVLSLGSAQPYQRYRVAVLDFDVTDLNAISIDTAAIGVAIARAFEIALVQSQRFTVITRSDLEQVMQEIALGAGGVVDADQAAQVGLLVGAEVIITGSVIINHSSSLSVNARFIGVSSGEIGLAVSRSGESHSDFPRIAQALVDEALVHFPIQAEVILIEGDRIFINVGSQAGLTENDQGGILQRVTEVAGLKFEEDIGTFSIAKLSSEASLIEVLLNPGVVLKVGDSAIMTDMSLAAPAESISETNSDLVQGSRDSAEASLAELLPTDCIALPAWLLVGGSITKDGVDCYSFEASAGDTISLLLINDISGMTSLTLSGPDGADIEKIRSAVDVAFQTTLAAAGKYTVVVNPEGDNSGDYALKVEPLP